MNNPKSSKFNLSNNNSNSKKINEYPKKINKRYNKYLINNIHGSRQDFVICGYSHNEEWLYGIVADGHGSNNIIKIIRNIDFAKIVDLPDFNDIFMKLIKAQINEEDSKGSGTTFSLVLIRDFDIKLYWIGDSKIRIYNENKRKLLYESNPTAVNPNDNDKISSLRITEQEPNMNIININYENDATYIGNIDMSALSTRYIYPNEDKVATFSLGHGHFFKNLAVESIPKPDGYTIILGSDGLWDMITDNKKDHCLLYEQSAEDIAKEAERRWHGKWKYHQGENTKETSFLKTNIDDIAVCTIQEYSSSKRKDISIPGGIASKKLRISIPEQEKLLKQCFSEIKVEEEHKA